MFQHSVRLFLALIATALVSGCSGGGSSAPPPAGGLTLVPKDGLILVSWNEDPGVQYDLWYAPTSNVESCQSTNGGIPAGCLLRTHIRSPYLASGLINGVTYYFVMNGRKSDGPAGANTAIVSATPSIAGATWQAAAKLGSSDMHGITYGTDLTNLVGYHLAVGDAGAIFNSTDGVSWTEVVPSPTVNNLNAALYSLGKFIAAGAAGNILYSPDTVTWTTAVSGAHTLNALGTDTATVVAVGDSGTILYSNNLTTWTAATSPTVDNLHGVAYSPFPNSTWIAVGDAGTLISSFDGVTWHTVVSGTNSNLESVAVLAVTNTTTLVTTYTFVAVGAGGTVLTSSDGVTWTKQIVGSAPDLFAVSAMSQFVAVGASGSVFTSPDGITWHQVTSGTAATLYGVIGAAGQYNAIGQAGANIYSQ